MARKLELGHSSSTTTSSPHRQFSVQHMSSQSALWLTEKQGSFALGPKEIPTPGPGEILVKIHSAGLNPIDWKIAAFGFLVEDYPAVLGNEAAGTVEAVGEGVANVVEGDKVFFQGPMDNRGAAFQQYAVAPAAVASKIPPNISFDEAAALSVGIATAVIPLYSQSPVGIGYQAPWDGGRGKYSGQPIVVLGGASSVGQYVIQLARLSGFSPIIATASPHNSALLASLGATHVLDRNLPFSAIADEISKITAVPVGLVYSTVALPDVQQGGYDVLAPGGHIVLVSTSSINPREGDGKKIVGVFGSWHAPGNAAFGSAVAPELTKLLADGDIVPAAVEVVPGGLGGVVAGLERLKSDQVSAKKLVVRPWETVL
ncbi:chaperonin 10-like protein [Hygrophoropsis aurantiaca]|uniref:Chaperonin 10-like protein n=1 Tax=Hygrophoropsis aurantiaca TaxID=72124 RepID=A0ACB7ZTZ8_9AGAM|nr:chaperonin 10-like protein [Hygrophoropsis aurantiaca]